jgi:hypothetical protein
MGGNETDCKNFEVRTSREVATAEWAPSFDGVTELLIVALMLDHEKKGEGLFRSLLQACMR